MSTLFIAKMCSCYFGQRLFAVATTRVTTVSRQRATVLIYDQFQSTVESRDATVGALQSKELIGENPNHNIFVVVFRITGATFKNLN